ncbi:O-antigen ligase family protein [Limnobacter parvus]|uniref:O-antigen ligase family protein n=1 Tax=Limnobacter parvus TaxID=2939690 RepID=A0ABT1XGC7_9BURK|nr:O-antigen ligase family protein [Limnobacter parvus]MCR2745921.1 O-antigen ligase family protein [Limnobacter parvus]
MTLATPKLIGLTALLGLGALFGVFANMFGQHVVLMLGTPLLLPLGLLLFVNPRLLFLVLIGTRCVLDPILESARFSSSFGLGALLNLLLIACAVIISIQANKTTVRQSVLLWILPLLVMALGITYSPEPLSAFKRMIAFVSYFSVFTVGMILIEENQLIKLLRVIVFSAVLPLLVGMYQFATGSLAVEGRLAATFTHPNIYAFYCLLVLIVLVYLQRLQQAAGEATPSITEKIVQWILLVLLIVSIILTQTRSAWLALILIGLMYGLLFSRKTLIWLLLGLSLAALSPAVQDRVVDLFSGNEVINYSKLNSFAWRQHIWESGLNWMSTSRYLLGYGIGGFIHHSPDFFPLSGGSKFGAHNVFVERFFDGGLLAFGVFSVFFLAQITNAFKLIKQDQFSALVYFGLLLSYLTLNASDNVVDYLAYNWYYWVVAGAFYATATRVVSSKASS